MPQPAPPPRTVRPRDELVTGWLLLLLDDGATYGYDLCRELESLAVSIDPSVVYRTLRRLEGDELVTSRWTSSLRGPRRRSYRLTAKGRHRLNETVRVIASIRDIHEVFLQAHEQARPLRRDSAA
jgi:DNA-binding PadR family transcriptional regulator